VKIAAKPALAWVWRANPRFHNVRQEVSMSKQRGKPNALKHGANSQTVLLWGETREDYESLRAGCFDEYCPDGPSEEYLVESLVDLLLRRRRVVRYSEIKLKDRLTRIRTNNKHSPFWERLSSLASPFEKLTSAEEVNKQLAQIGRIHRDYIFKAWPLAKDGDEKTWGAKIAKGLAALTVPAILEKGNQFIAAFDAGSIEYLLMPLERIDAEIERVLKRLVQTKTMKQALYRLHPQVITISSPNKPNEVD
jgi:hypothetical protein